MKLILVRHGESVGNLENRLQGQEDYDLTNLGRRQAELTAVRLHDEGTSTLYTSPLLRAASTATAIGEVLGCAPVLLPGVAEYSFGELSGMTYREVREHFAATPETANLPAAEREYPGEEGRINFERRVTEAIWRVVAEHARETVAVVSHGGPIALFCQSILGLPYKRPMPFGIDNCSLAIIEAPDGGSPRDAAVLVRLNDTGHLAPLREAAVD
jgi:broad specificity phosphatase PhoE